MSSAFMFEGKGKRVKGCYSDTPHSTSQSYGGLVDEGTSVSRPGEPVTRSHTGAAAGRTAGGRPERAAEGLSRAAATVGEGEG